MNFLDAALQYAERGWSVLPIKHRPNDPKTPAVRWKPFMTRRPTASELRSMFARTDLDGLAVVHGEVSGGLACRDFDKPEAYTAWADAHPALARTLPTSASSRGRHVYARVPAEGFYDYDDGEYRANRGHYTVLPPSRHNDGVTVYKWTVPLPHGPLPMVDPVEAGFIPPHATERTESTERDREHGASNTASVSPFALSALSQDLDDALRATLPELIGQRNGRVFDLARVLKARPDTADLPVKELRPVVRRWHDMGRAKGVIGTADFDSTWVDFVTAWGKVRFPAGAGPMDALWARVQAEPPPPEAAIYDTPHLRQLVALCRGLHNLNPDAAAFYLSCRTAARYIGVDHATAARYFRVLVADGLLETVDRGGQSHNPRKASRYRYLGGA